MVGRVTSFHACPIHFFAEVQGTDTYTVGLDYMEEASDLGVSCSCPYFESNGVCKHIWAALLAAQKERALVRADVVESKLTELEFEAMQEIIDEVEDDAMFTRPGTQLKSLPVPKALTRSRNQPIAEPDSQRRQGNWQSRLAGVRSRLIQAAFTSSSGQRSRNKEALYVINCAASLKWNSLKLNVGYRERKKDGEWGAPKFTGIRSGDIHTFSNDVDQQILSLLVRNEGTDSWRYYYNYSARMEFDISPTIAPLLLPMMSNAERLFVSKTGDPKLHLPVHYHSGEEWKGHLVIDEVEGEKKAKPGSGTLQLQMQLSSGDEQISPAQIEQILPGNLLLIGDRLAQFTDAEILPILQTFASAGPIVFPATRLNNVLEELSQLPITLPIKSTDAVRFETLAPEPIPILRLKRQFRRTAELFVGDLHFDYGGTYVQLSDTRSGLLNPKERQQILRNSKSEQQRINELDQEGFSVIAGMDGQQNQWQISKKKFTPAIKELIAHGWLIEAEGKRFRTGGRLNMQVSSGIDWFDLHGTVNFDEGVVSLPNLLKAISHGESTVLLDDGSYGLLPEEWVKRYDKLAKAAVQGAEGKALRFGSNQIVLLDMLLAELPEANFDEKFREARERLQTFAGIVPLDPPKSFNGDLRPYQKIALGWFHFLREFGFGGCLADDMGLGKTVQALALLEERRLQREGKQKMKKGDEANRPNGPSLAVVPKSLIFNWIQEAARFAPKLRVLDYTGTGRKEFHDSLDKFDLILTTYGTLRRDIPKLREQEFDYLILDESQAIKNEKSATAKAARLLNGRHRLAMSGTPIENRIEELWSLFEFLNPGMLGSANMFSALAGSPDADDTRKVLSQSLRPFILRRTKENVAADLPEKVEQTIFCELDKTQRKLYNELRDHFRTSVLHEIDTNGMARSKIKVLEALLRLRQAACHPALIDKTKAKTDCAKFDLLLPQLQEIVEEGHKALVFSQFTSFLALLRPKLEAEKIGYIYLDGKTQNRQEKVEQFQNDPNASLFLISLKAGGVGLNLTAAEYVFLLDPWWNPAVEAQAIDRTHRIGQTNNVFAYRLIAKDTVEEKVLELQESKRQLAEAIITGENALIRNLAREDLELLLS